MCYVKARKLSLEELLPYIPEKSTDISRSFWCPTIKRCVLLQLGGARMRLFGRQQECAACKIRADHFWIEKNHACFYGWHANMYAYDYHGNPVMLTLDHIKPKSKGGTRTPKNVQLLCRKCNNTKGDQKMSLEQIVQRRAQQDVVLRKSLEQAGILPVCQYRLKAS